MRLIAILTAAAQARRRQCRRAVAATAAGPDGPAVCASSRRGFTYTELLVSLGIVGAVTAVLLPLVGRSRASAQSVSCLLHLRQIGAAFVQYAAENDKRLPDPFEVQTSWEELLLRYLPDKEVFRCPADNELFPSVGSSYDWRDTPRPETTLAGRPMTDSSRPDPVLAFEALPGWHVKGRMNAVTLSGAASSMDQEACMEDLQQPIRMLPLRPGHPGSGGGSGNAGAASGGNNNGGNGNGGGNGHGGGRRP